jgi:hypothetical protein
VWIRFKRFVHGIKQMWQVIGFYKEPSFPSSSLGTQLIFEAPLRCSFRSAVGRRFRKQSFEDKRRGEA